MGKKTEQAKSRLGTKSKLRPAKFQVERILERVSDSIVALDTEWRYTYVNEKAAQIFGRKPEQLIGKHIWTEFPEGVGQPFYKAYYKAVETQQPIFLEEYYPPYDRWFENRVYPSRDGLSIFFHDITDHKKAELTVQDSERRFREMLENVQLIAVLLDLDGRVTFCNEFLLQITGYKRDEVLGCDWFEKFVTDVRTDVRETFLQALKHGEIAAQYENPIRTKSGAERFIRFSNTFLRDAQGKIIGTTSFGEDITERKQVQEELQRNEQVLRLFVENSPAAIAMFDRDMKYIVASHRYLVDYDLGNQDVTGRSHYEIFPEMPERWKDIHRRCLAGATERAEEDPFPRASGKLDWVRWEIRPWYEQTGEIGGIILFSEVITEHKQAEQDLRESEERYRLLFHRSPIGVVQYDRNLRVVDCNERFLQILRTSREKVIGLDIHNLRDQGGLPAFQKSLAGEEGFAENLYQATTSDARVWLTTRTAPLFDPAGNVRGGVAIMEDITDRKRAEEKLRLSEEKFSKTFHASPDIIVLTSLADGRIIEVNESLQRATGYTHDEIIGKTTAELHFWANPADRESYAALLRRDGKVRDLEVDFRIKSGEIRDALLSGEIIEFHDGKYILGVIRDITERKRAEEEIRHYMNQLTALNKAALELQRLHSPQILAKEIIKSLEMILDYTYSAVLLIEETTSRLVPFALSAQKQGESFVKQDKRYIESAEIHVGEGITGWVAQTGRSVCLGDVRQDKRYLGIRDDIRSELCVPLKAGEQVIGVINIESVQLDAYAESDERVLETVAAQVSIAIQNARLLESELKRRREAEALQQATAAITSSLDLKHILESLLVQLSAIMPLDSASVILLKNEQLVVVAGQGFAHPERIIGLEFPADDPLTKIMRETRRFIIIPNVREDARFMNWGEASLISGWMGIPLIVQDDVIGYLTVDSQTDAAFTESHAELAQSFANQAAVAIHNARLLEETRLSRDRLGELSRRLVEVHETEQRAIGRELHDQIGQMLTALKLTLEIASQLPPELREKKNRQTQELVNDLLKRVSALSLELRPPMLDDLGLIPALLWHINRFEEQTGIAVSFKHSGAEGRRFSAEVETTAYRVIQEAFTNVARHARASRTRLEVHAGRGRMKIQIEDDGAGFDPQAAFEKHRGLGGMRERTGLLGGTFRVESQTGKGTSLFIELPLKENT